MPQGIFSALSLRRVPEKNTCLALLRGADPERIDFTMYVLLYQWL